MATIRYQGRTHLGNFARCGFTEELLAHPAQRGEGAEARNPTCTGVLLCADGGGSNGSRNRAWKYHLQQLADQLGRELTVCHYPPGTSKWNKIEHRMFSFISLNWKGQPLVSYETVVNLIGTTRTRGGLRVKAALDSGSYELGVKIPDAEMARLHLKPHRTLPAWNYTLAPHKE